MGGASSMKFTPAGSTTLTAGGTAAYWFGASHESATGAAPPTTIREDFDGGLIVTPGQLVFLCGSVAQTGIFTCSLMWAEIDI
jgi:hypothetical protein